ncbi:DUF1883 domain-containing protein [Micromonospora chersina]|uniref:DUF1883 domain-containing protein n=1 Tax=Micromonospora chersina TaxID=47854 RepID=UPI003711DD4A
MSANIIVHDLKQQPAGATAVVTLKGNAANVRLMDASNLRAFKAGRQCRFYGGLAKRSPVRIRIPRRGHWYVTVDLMGMRSNARVQSGVHVEPPPLAPIRSATEAPLTAIRHERPPVLQTNPSAEVWDVFISHAHEDKEAVARPLAAALRERGVTVWLDETELRIGDSLRRKIDEGLANSSFGVVIFSRSFFAKGWPQYELDGLVTRSNSGEQAILPIWHEITKDEVMAQSPSLAGSVARSTAQFTISEIAAEIAEVVVGPAPADEEQ